MRKTILTLSVATVLGCSVALSGLPIKVAAETSKLQELDNKRSTIKSNISEVEQEINRLKKDQQKVNEEIKRFDFAIADAQQKVTKKQQEIRVTEEEIAQLKEDINLIQERIEKRNDLLKDRARSYQANGNMISYIDVLLGSKSFSDLIERVGAVAIIVEADQDILQEHVEDKNLLENAKSEVEKKLTNLQTMLRELDSMIESLNIQKAEKEKIMQTLKQKVEDVEEYKMELEEEDQLLSSQQSAIQNAIQLEHQLKSGQASTNTRGGRDAAVSIPPVSSGNFTSPTSGTITSGFGGRSGGSHYGVDIAKSGTVPVVAAADGVVIRSYYSSSYGNVVFISHSIDGQIYTSVYAHMNTRNVSAGQVVSKGQQVGYQGNTGRSFGQHLHFELHKGQWNAGKTNAINPSGIVPL